MNEIIETLKNEIRAKEQFLFVELEVLKDIQDKIESGDSNVIAPSVQKLVICKLEGQIDGFKRAIDLINLALIEERN